MKEKAINTFKIVQEKIGTEAAVIAPVALVEAVVMGIKGGSSQALLALVNNAKLFAIMTGVNKVYDSAISPKLVEKFGEDHYIQKHAPAILTFAADAFINLSYSQISSFANKVDTTTKQLEHPWLAKVYPEAGFIVPTFMNGLKIIAIEAIDSGYLNNFSSSDEINTSNPFLETVETQA